ncbi:TRAF-interacting protein with FHA domain-containing protein A [Chanos chanos]|uniref:TRAF-interacting protein with FHA domain-containing protein A n=1 Tax=Chanos chanos TaxID=29144 RepID=A0A6J2VQ85_CHACN|nr:TRAF-interacting protein with FHA domain-containing protein A [Chanos chanos]
MAVSQTVETEELNTCLYIELYNPDQASQPLYAFLPLNRRQTHEAEDPLRFGRDGAACTFGLNDPRVSRKQFSVQAYRLPGSPRMLFALQNMSQKSRMTVGGKQLGYLERVELDDKALVRFGKYELLLRVEPGDGQARFEVLLQTRHTPLSREMGVDVQCRQPVMDAGIISPHQDKETLTREPSESDDTW